MTMENEFYIIKKDILNYLIDRGDGCDESCLHSFVEFVQKDRIKQETMEKQYDVFLCDDKGNLILHEDDSAIKLLPFRKRLLCKLSRKYRSRHVEYRGFPVEIDESDAERMIKEWVNQC